MPPPNTPGPEWDEELRNRFLSILMTVDGPELAELRRQVERFQALQDSDTTSDAGAAEGSRASRASSVSSASRASSASPPPSASRARSDSHPPIEGADSRPSTAGSGSDTTPPANASGATCCGGLRNTCLLPFNYQDLEYQSTVDDALLCPICHTPFCEPVTSLCGHTFCSACLYRALEDKPQCPVDRKTLVYNPERLCKTHAITTQLDRLQVKCPNAPCDHITTRGLVVAHYERYCEYTPVHCPDLDCNERIPRMDATAEKGCLHKGTTCQYCKATVLIADLEKHYDTNCSDHTVKCARCNVIVVRHRLGAHIANDCLEAETKCQWSLFGCSLHGKRRVVLEHEKAGCVYKAIGRLTRERMEDRSIINDLRGKLTTAETRLQRMESSSASRAHGMPPSMQGWQFSGDHTMPSLDLNGGPGPATYTHRDEDSSGWESAEDYMLAQFESMGTKIEDLRKMVTEMDGRHSMMLLNETMPLKEQLAELRSNMGVLSMHTTWLMNFQRQSRAQQQQQRASGPASLAGQSGGGGGGGGTSVAGNSGVSRGHAEHSAGNRRSGAEPPPRL